MVNNIFKLFSFSSFPLFSILGIAHIRSYFIKMCFSTIFVIVLYAGVEVVFALDEKPKLNSNAFYSRNGLIEPGKVLFLPILVDRIKADKLINDGGFELGGSGKELLSLHKFHAGFIGELCAKGGAAKSSNDSRNSADNNDTGSGHDEVSLQFVIGYITLLIFCMFIGWGGGLWFFYYLTQRRNQP